MRNVAPFGERALRFALGERKDRASLFDALRAVPGVVDVVLTEEEGAVIFDGPPEAEAIAALLEAPARAAASAEARSHEIAVTYDGADLEELAASLGMSTSALVELHASGDYEVAMMGFMPGFAYLTGLPPPLVVPRRAEPRARVPAGSLAMAAGYTGIYPFASAGGWHLLGRVSGFTAFSESGATLGLGDRVRFVPTTNASTITAREPIETAIPDRDHLEIKTARGPAIVIDGGRAGHMHEGVPGGGPLVRSALARANAAVGNDPGAAAIELYGALDVIARGAIALADDHGVVRELADGEALTLANDGASRVRYLAVAGGLDVPRFLGSQSTLLTSQLGGLEGRPLRRGDRLAVRSPFEPRALAVLPGPDATPEVLAAITSATFTIAAASDRTGTRLEGPALPPARETSAPRKSKPLVRGAIEAAPSGLIVLGPDHPTTGGYPVVAVLAEAAQDAFFALPIGKSVRFVVQ